ncbi:MAG: sel1 repeat family protein [Nitrospinae bacterium]|nr:sel1 repeat family protein [Nitrospinota bacterium]
MKKTILLVLLLMGLCLSLSSFVWADDDPQTAKMRAACEDGNSTACFKMGERYRIIERDNKIARAYFVKACEGGYMTGCTNGGILLFMEGQHGSAQWKQAKKMFAKACEAGEDPSCYNLGTLSYKEGRQSRAIKFYHKACEMGNPAGCAREKRLKR